VSAARSPSVARAGAAPAFDASSVRAEFPILGRRVHDRPLVYLDNAATTQKPVAVIDAIDRYYRTINANVHRGVHRLSEEATEAFEGARERVRRFLGAAESREIVFVRGTTEAVNLVAQSWGRANVQEGDEVLITAMEHHSNIVPWQMLCRERRAHLRVAPIDDRGALLFEEWERMLGPRTRIAAFGHVSNALGTVNPVAAMVRAAHARGVPVFVDGAQAVPHLPVDVRALGADFYAFSAHKVYGPTGIGVLYGRGDLLDAMAPFMGGGDMIRTVSFEETTFNVPPWRFEAGTPDIAGAVGLAAALDWVSAVGLDRIAAWEHRLLRRATDALSDVPGLRLVGTAPEKAAVVSFVLDGVHPHDVGTVLDRAGIAVRTGHHCAQPVMERFAVPATTRASFACYSTLEEIDVLVSGLHDVRRMFS
jgi:cysteine desulfurase/selenocysteine lyase